jgi:hypothetical protein
MNHTSVSSRGVSRSFDSDCSESRFEAEPLLPSQFFEGRKKNEALEPEKRLMLAVLTDAVHCYQVGFRAQKPSRIRAFREAEKWLFSAKSYGPYSCENVCYALDITPDYLRRMLRKWRVRRLDGARITVVRRSTG